MNYRSWPTNSYLYKRARRLKPARLVFGTNDIGQRLPRFMTVGLMGTLLDVRLFTTLHTLLGIPALTANTLSYSAGIINNYTWHRHWTYADRPRKTVGTRLAQFVAISLSALLLNNLLLLLLAPPFNALLAHAGYGDILAKLCATGVGMCWNFLANHFWTFAAATR